MNVLIVDDEKRARETITQIIKLYCPEITHIREADSVQTAVIAITAQKPDLLLLDIRLGDGNGFDVLKQTLSQNLNVIFITAYDEYAIKAFKVSAIDYLLKPIDPDDFAEAIQKAQQKLNQSNLDNRISLFLNNIENQNSKPQKITLKTADSIHLVQIADIIYCEADRNYTTFCLINNQKIIVSKSLGEYEELLPTSSFIRPHQSFLVNVNHILRYEKGDKNCLITTEDYEIPVSIRKKDFVIQFLSQLK